MIKEVIMYHYTWSYLAVYKDVDTEVMDNYNPVLQRILFKIGHSV